MGFRGVFFVLINKNQYILNDLNFIEHSTKTRRLIFDKFICCNICNYCKIESYNVAECLIKGAEQFNTKFI